LKTKQTAITLLTKKLKSHVMTFQNYHPLKDKKKKSCNDRTIKSQKGDKGKYNLSVVRHKRTGKVNLLCWAEIC